jgi:hypothetical protein
MPFPAPYPRNALIQDVLQNNANLGLHPFFQDAHSPSDSARKGCVNRAKTGSRTSPYQFIPYTGISPFFFLFFLSFFFDNLTHVVLASQMTVMMIDQPATPLAGSFHRGQPL